MCVCEILVLGPSLSDPRSDLCAFVGACVERVTAMQELINKAIVASVAARREWDLKPVQDRAQILFKAADVISGPSRAEILAKTMIGQVARLGAAGPTDARLWC